MIRTACCVQRTAFAAIALARSTQCAFRGTAACLSFIALVAVSAGYPAENEKSKAAASVERRQKVELMGFFMKDPKDAKLPGTPMAVQLYNQAVVYFKNNDFALARQTLRESLKYDDLNSLAYELLGDLDFNEQKLKEAKSNYEIAYNLQPTSEIRQKLEKTLGEEKVDKKLATYTAEHFIIKYHNQEKGYEGFELRELLRNAYSGISKDFGHYFKHQIVVLLYDQKDFAEITKLPHWVAGVYDGKVRMPINRAGYSESDFKALAVHEVTHAFVAGMSGQRAPSWINEGLAQVQENKIRPIDLLVFNAAVKTGSLLPLLQLTNEAGVSTIKDQIDVALFYQQSFRLTDYLIKRYGMFTVKKMLAEFSKGKNSEEAIRAALQISPDRLEKEWKATLTK